MTARRFRGDAGQAAIELPLGFLWILLPIAVIVMVIPQWPERQTVATAAAKEAATLYATAATAGDGAAAAEAAVAQAAAELRAAQPSARADGIVVPRLHRDRRRHRRHPRRASTARRHDRFHVMDGDVVVPSGGLRVAVNDTARRGRGDNGSITLLMIGATLIVMFVGWLAFTLWAGASERRQLASAADQAAQAGATALNVTVFRQSGTRQLDPRPRGTARPRQLDLTRRRRPPHHLPDQRRHRTGHGDPRRRDRHRSPQDLRPRRRPHRDTSHRRRLPTRRSPMIGRAPAVAIKLALRRTRGGIALLALSLFAVACDDGDPSTEPTTTPVATTTAATLTDTSPATSPTTAATTPKAPTGNIGARASADISNGADHVCADHATARLSGLGAGHPVAREHDQLACTPLPILPEFLRPVPFRSSCEADLQAQFGDLINQGARVVDSPPFRVVSANVVAGKSRCTHCRREPRGRHRRGS